MITGINYEELNKQNILNKISEYDIYKFYIGHNFELGKPFSSPLRDDKNPSFNIYKPKVGYTNNLYFKDFGGESGNVFDFVCDLHKIPRNLAKACFIINKDFKLGLVNNPSLIYTKNNTFDNFIRTNKIKKRNSPIIEIKYKHPEIFDIEYWAKGNISTDTLKLFNVYCAEEIWLKNDEGPFKLMMKHKKENPIYVYPFNQRFKIYRPFAKVDNNEIKWLSNINSFDIQGLNQLRYQKDYLIITKSLKDVMCLYELGYDAIAPHSEGSYIPEEIMNDLKKHYKHFIVFYDNDDPGVKASRKLTELFNLHYFNIPKIYLEKYGIKDSYDFISIIGSELLVKMITSKLINLKIKP